MVSGDRHEIKLYGGNVGGAVRVGDTVRRQQGPWTPAVHALLNYLDGRVPAIPEVLGTDDQNREILSYLPGRVIDTDTERLNDGQIVSLVRWTRGFHHAVAGFTHPGPWRFFPVTQPSLICHNDIAPYNACFAGDEVTGVFDWDLAGPSTPLFELAFIAWNCVPLWRDIGPDNAAQRLGLIASAYGEFTASQILHAVPDRMQQMLEWIPVAAAAGDEGMANVMAAGEPGRSAAALAGLVSRIPVTDRLLLDQRLRRPLWPDGFGAELQLGNHEVTPIEERGIHPPRPAVRPLAELHAEADRQLLRKPCAQDDDIAAVRGSLLGDPVGDAVRDPRERLPGKPLPGAAARFQPPLCDRNGTGSGWKHGLDQAGWRVQRHRCRRSEVETDVPDRANHDPDQQHQQPRLRSAAGLPATAPT